MDESNFRDAVINIIEDFFKDGGFIRGNRINVGDFEVSSISESLGEVEKTMNRLIQQHKDFAQLRKQKLGFENHGIY